MDNITTINLGACPLQYLSIGYVGETGARAQVFDFSAWAAEYGAGVLQLLLQRPRDAEPYPVYLSIDGTGATWTPNDTDTEKPGQGQAQLVYTIGGVVVKNAIFRVLIAPSLGAAGDPPEPYETWLERLTELAAETQQSALDAAESAEDAAESAEGAEAAKIDAQTAKTAAETAATAAGVSAGTAAEKAAQAAQSAQTAAQGASAAQQGAEDAEASKTAAALSAASAAQARTGAETAAQAAGTSATGAAGSAAAAAAAVTEVETKGAEQIAAINQAGTTQIAAVDAAGAVQVQTIEDKGSEVLASIPADYSELSEGYLDLKSHLFNGTPLIDYAVRDLDYTGTPGKSDSTCLAVKRRGSRIVLNGGNINNESRPNVFVKLTGSTTGRTNNSLTVRTWADGITLKNGRTYRATVVYVSGESSSENAPPAVTVSVYTLGQSATIGYGTRDGNGRYIRYFTAAGELNLCLFVPCYQITYTDYTVDVILEEVDETVGVHLPSMVTNRALAVNDFRIVDNELFRVTAPVASGDFLIPGTNCVKTTVAEVLTQILNA